MKPFHLLLLTLFLSLSSTAQQAFEGKIVTKIEVLESSKDTKRMAAMMGKEVITYIKGAKSRIVQSNALGQTVIISDSIAKESTILLDLMGKKMGIRTTGEEAQSNSMIPQVEGTFTTTTEHKMILGFDCVKTIFTLKDNSGSFEIWTALSIPNLTPNYPELAGYPLEFVLVTPDAKIKFTTTEITPTVITEDYFAIPSEYEIKSQEEMSKMLPSIGHE
jgi:hypothetical protein